MDLNSFSITGRIGGDVTTGVTPNGKTWANFSVAVSQRKGDEPIWMKCVAWGGTAETLGDYGRKGRRIAISGELRRRTYTASDGTTKEVLELVVGQFAFLDSTTTQY